MESHFDDHEIHQPLLSTHDQSPPPSPPPPELNSRLEEVLSNKQLPLLKRFLSATWIELKFLFPLAGPTIIVYVINNLMSTVTRAVAGHLGNLQLAAANLGNSGVQLFAYGLMVMFLLPLISIHISGVMLQIGVGFNAAASVRVSNELGAGNPKSAAFSVIIVNVVSFVIAVIEAIVVLSLRHVVSYAFTDGETVANVVSDLCPYLAITLILNGVQPVLSGVAVGCGWQAIVAYVGCYYGIGIPLGCILGFKFDLGVKGIWSGMIGGTVLQTLILLLITFCTDWIKEVNTAKKRLDKWEH